MRVIRTSPQSSVPLGQAITDHTRYQHYLRISSRICRCLQLLGVKGDLSSIGECLRSYYLFIGAADDAIDSVGVEAGRAFLSSLDGEAEGGKSVISSCVPASERLNRHIMDGTRARILDRLGELYSAVIGERSARTMAEYISRRRQVGELTAEVSYLLIEPFLTPSTHKLLSLFRKVGAAGCLFDSVVDLRRDERLGLIRFRVTTFDRLRLTVETLVEGARLFFQHPRLAGLFLEAALDVVLERFSGSCQLPAVSRQPEKIDLPGGASS